MASTMEPPQSLRTSCARSFICATGSINTKRTRRRQDHRKALCTLDPGMGGAGCERRSLDSLVLAETKGTAEVHRKIRIITKRLIVAVRAGFGATHVIDNGQVVNFALIRIGAFGTMCVPIVHVSYMLIWVVAERWQSGRLRRSRKPLNLYGFREFESPPLRQPLRFQ